MTALVLPRPGRLILLDAWRFLRPLKMIAGQFYPGVPIQFEEARVGWRSVALSYVTTVVDLTNITSGSYTFSGASIGAAAPDRQVILGIINSGGGSHGTPTIGGNNATSIVGTAGQASLWRLLVPSGTTADIVVPHASGSLNRCSVSIWRLTGYRAAAPFSTDSVASGVSRNSISVTLATKPRGGLVVVGRHDKNEDTTIANADERYDATEEATQRTYGADKVPSVENAGLTITASWTTATTVNGIAGAAWR